MSIRDQLSEVIRKSGLSQGEVARRAELTPGAVSKYISGDSAPSMAAVERIITVCGGSIEIRPAGSSSSPALAQLVEAAQSLSEEDLARLAKMARGIPLVNKMMKDAIAEDWGSRGERAETEAARKRA